MHKMMLLVKCCATNMDHPGQENQQEKTPIALAQDQLESVRWQAVALTEIETVDRMSGGDFERYVIHLLKHRGFDSCQIGRSGDGGVDLLAVKDGVRYSVQCKRHNKTISRRAVSDAVGGLRQYDCSKAMVLTNSYLTAQAMQVAKANDCVVVDRQTLLAWIADFRRAIAADPDWFKNADAELKRFAPPELPLPPEGATLEWVLHHLDSETRTYELLGRWRLFAVIWRGKLRYKIIPYGFPSLDVRLWLRDIGCTKQPYGGDYLLPLEGTIGVLGRLLEKHPIVRLRLD